MPTAGATTPRTLHDLAVELGIPPETARSWPRRGKTDFPVLMLGGTYVVMPEHFNAARKCLRRLFRQGQSWRGIKKPRVSST